MNQPILTPKQRTGLTILSICLAMSSIAFLIGFVMNKPIVYLSSLIGIVMSISWLSDIFEIKD